MTNKNNRSYPMDRMYFQFVIPTLCSTLVSPISPKAHSNACGYLMCFNRNNQKIYNVVIDRNSKAICFKKLFLQQSCHIPSFISLNKLASNKETQRNWINPWVALSQLQSCLIISRVYIPQVKLY